MTSGKSFKPSDKHIIPQLTLAIVLVKSKPPSLTIEEYIDGLRSCIQQGGLSQSLSQLERHFDAAAFWRDAFIKSEESQLGLRKQIAALEKERSDRQGSVISEEPRMTIPGAKRTLPTPSRELEKLASKQTQKANISSPLRKHRNQSTQTPDFREDGGPQDFPNPFLHQITFLRCPETIRDHGAQAALDGLHCFFSGIDQLVKSTSDLQLPIASQQPHDPKSLSKSINGHDLTFVERVEQSLLSQLRLAKMLLQYEFEHLNRIERQGDALSYQNHLAAQVTKCFKGIITQIFELAPRSNQPEKSARHNGCISSRTRQRHSQAQSGPSPPDRSLIVFVLCDMALAILKVLDSSRPSQAKALEDCLYLLLTETGIRLRDCVFPPEDPGLDQISATDLGLHLYDAENAKASNFAAEGPYIIYMLERAPGLSGVTHAGRNLEASPSSQTTRDSSPAERESSNNHLRQKAAPFIQNTILRAMFGDHMSSNFGLALTAPVAAEQSSSPPNDKEDEAKVRAWFMQEIWRIIGWNVLREDLDPYERMQD